MQLRQNISNLESKATSQLNSLTTKEKTKNALVLPFFDLLGYDPFDVRQVEPGFVVEVEQQGTETVDYALKIDGAPGMLVQCEQAKSDLDALEGNPVFRHFQDVDANVFVLTNGLTYRFYADLQTKSDIERRPFLEFNLLHYEAENIEELKWLTRTSFDSETLRSAAFERTYSRLLEQYFVRQQSTPDDHFVRFLAAQVHAGDVSTELLGRFQSVVQDVLKRMVNNQDIQPNEQKRVENSPPTNGDGMPRHQEGPTTSRETDERPEEDVDSIQESNLSEMSAPGESDVGDDATSEEESASEGDADDDDTPKSRTWEEIIQGS